MIDEILKKTLGDLLLRILVLEAQNAELRVKLAAPASSSPEEQPREGGSHVDSPSD